MRLSMSRCVLSCLFVLLVPGFLTWEYQMLCRKPVAAVARKRPLPLTRGESRALDYGGLAYEDDKPDTLAEAMASLERGLTEYFEREGIEREE
jgi:hypothetical protein